jgi:predicted Rossmann fold nucleotide-binding protein DprA/Smf involved in DNA uptake
MPHPTYKEYSMREEELISYDEREIRESLEKGNRALIEEGKFIVEIPKDLYETVECLFAKNYIGHNTKVSQIVQDAILFAYSEDQSIKRELGISIEEAGNIRDSSTTGEESELHIRGLMAKENHALVKEGKFLIEMPKDLYRALKGLSLEWYRRTGAENAPKDDSTVICEAIRMFDEFDEFDSIGYPEHSSLEFYGTGYPDYNEIKYPGTGYPPGH